QTALEQITALTGNIAVAQTGGTYLVGFHGGLAAQDVPGLDVGTQTLTPQNEQQTVLVLNASAGTFTLTLSYDANSDGTIAANEKATTAAIPFNATATDVLNKLNALTISPSGTTISFSGDFGVVKSGNTYTITFQGALLSGKDIQPLIADSGKLRNTNELGTIAASLAATDTSLFTSPDDLV